MIQLNPQTPTINGIDSLVKSPQSHKNASPDCSIENKFNLLTDSMQKQINFEIYSLDFWHLIFTDWRRTARIIVLQKIFSFSFFFLLFLKFSSSKMLLVSE